MSGITTTRIHAPYLVFVADVENEVYAKTGLGIVQWRPDLCLGQYRLTETAVDLGLPDMSPAEAAAAGARSLVVGIANVGGTLPESSQVSLLEAADCGLDIVAGMHSHLAEVPGLAVTAAANGARLVDVRVPPANLPVGTGKKRSGRRLLTVGTDCAVGKKYAALAIEREMLARSMKATFRATGQTGIMIAGEGIPIDAVVADFLSGAAEVLSPANDAEHWDVIEGQGSLFHPGYAGVTLGLLHGSQPDAVVLCHEAGRKEIELWEGFSTPKIRTAIEKYLSEGSFTNPDIRCIGVCINTSTLPATQREEYLRELEVDIGLRCIDPLVDGVGRIVDQIQLDPR
ncbi:MAG: DUF1611 domain-containing protein [Acidobacteriota bacterium]